MAYPIINTFSGVPVVSQIQYGNNTVFVKSLQNPETKITPNSLQTHARVATKAKNNVSTSLLCESPFFISDRKSVCC